MDGGRELRLSIQASQEGILDFSDLDLSSPLASAKYMWGLCEADRRQSMEVNKLLLDVYGSLLSRSRIGSDSYKEIVSKLNENVRETLGLIRRNGEVPGSKPDEEENTEQSGILEDARRQWMKEFGHDPSDPEFKRNLDELIQQVESAAPPTSAEIEAEVRRKVKEREMRLAK